jgi:DNA-binding transcriptional MerR regulator
MDGPWTLAELTTRAASVLSDGRSAPLSGRVRDLPGERTIRWYVTIGLVDPPLSRRGRIAVYGPRHLLQLVAIKRRQAEGRSLADIQAELTGATDATLQRIARLDLPAASPAEAAATPAPAPGERPSPPGAPAPDEAAQESATDGTGPERVTGGSRPESRTDAPAAESATGGTESERVTGGSRSERLGDGPAPGRSARRFWAERPTSAPGRAPMPHGVGPAPNPPSADGTPATAGAHGAAANGTDDVGAISPPDASGTAGVPGVGALVRGVRLAPGVTLLLDSSPSPDDATAIVAAAAPLLDLLSERGLR